MSKSSTSMKSESADQAKEAKVVAEWQQVITTLSKMERPLIYIEDEIKKNLPTYLLQGSFNTGATVQTDPFNFKLILPLSELHYYTENLPESEFLYSQQLNLETSQHTGLLREYAQHFCRCNNQFKPKGDISKVKINRKHDIFFSFCTCKSCLKYREIIMTIVSSQYKAAHLVALLRDAITKTYKPLLKNDIAAQKFKEAVKDNKNKFWILSGHFNKTGLSYFDFVDKIPCSGNMVLILFSTILMVNNPMNLLQILSASLECVIQGFCHGVSKIDESSINKTSAEKFLTYLLDGYNELNQISQKVAFSLFALENDFLRAFKITWILLSQRLFQIHVQAVHADSLLKCIIKLKEEEIDGEYTNVIKRYITFEENMTYVRHRWNQTWTELNKFNCSEKEILRHQNLLKIYHILDKIYMDANSFCLSANKDEVSLRFPDKLHNQSSWLNLLLFIRQKFPNGITAPPKTVKAGERCHKCKAVLDFHKENCDCITCSIAGGPIPSSFRGICASCQIADFHQKDPTLKQLKVMSKERAPASAIAEAAQCTATVKKSEAEPRTTTIYHIAWAVFQHLSIHRRYNYATIDSTKFCSQNCRVSACLLARKILNNELSPMVSKQLALHYQPLSISRDELYLTLPCIMMLNRKIPNYAGDMKQDEINFYIMKMYWTFVLSIYANFFIENIVPTTTNLDNLKIVNNDIRLCLDDIIGNENDTKFEEFLECIKRLAPLSNEEVSQMSLDVYNERLKTRLSDLMAVHDAQRKRQPTSAPTDPKTKTQSAPENNVNSTTGNCDNMPKSCKDKSKKCCWYAEMGEHCKENHSKKRLKKECHHGRYNETRERLRKKLLSSRPANGNDNSTSTSECATNANSAATSRTASHSEPNTNATGAVKKSETQTLKNSCISDAHLKLDEKRLENPESLTEALKEGHTERWLNEKLDYIEGKVKAVTISKANPKKAAKKAKQKQRKEEEKRVIELEDLRGQFQDIYFKEFTCKHELKSLKASKKRDKKRLAELELNIKKLQRAKAKVETAILELIATVKQSNSEFKFSYLPTKEQQLEKMQDIENAATPKLPAKKDLESIGNNSTPDATKYIELDQPFFSEYNAKIAISNAISQQLPSDPSGMITIKRIHNPNMSEPQVTVTAKGSIPEQDKLLGKFVNGNWVRCTDKIPCASNGTDKEQKKQKNKQALIDKHSVEYCAQLLSATKLMAPDNPKKNKSLVNSSHNLTTSKAVISSPNKDCTNSNKSANIETKKKKKNKVEHAKVKEEQPPVAVQGNLQIETKKSRKMRNVQLQNNPFQTLHMEESTTDESENDGRTCQCNAASNLTSMKKSKKGSSLLQNTSAVQKIEITKTAKAKILPKVTNPLKSGNKSQKLKSANDTKPQDVHKINNEQLVEKKSQLKNKTPAQQAAKHVQHPLLATAKGNSQLKQTKNACSIKAIDAQQPNPKKSKRNKRSEAGLANITGIPDNMGYFDANTLTMAPTHVSSTPYITSLGYQQNYPIVDTLGTHNGVNYNGVRPSAKVSIMDQLNQGVSVEHLALPPGITLTKVDPSKSEELRQKSEAISKLIKPLQPTKQSLGQNAPNVITSSPMSNFYNTKYPAAKAVEKSGIIMIQHPAKQHGACGQPPKDQTTSNSKTARRRRRNKAKSACNVTENQRVQPNATQSKMITLRNPMFHAGLSAPAIVPQHPLQQGRSFNAASVNAQLPLDQPAAIIRNDNGMLTIRNPALHQAVTSGLSLSGYHQFGNSFYSPQNTDSEQQARTHSTKQAPNANSFSYFTTENPSSNSVLNASSANNAHSNISISCTNNFRDKSILCDDSASPYTQGGGKLTGEAAVIARPKPIAKNISAIGSEMKLKSKTNIQYPQYMQDFPTEYNPMDKYNTRNYFNGLNAAGTMFDGSDNHVYPHNCGDESPPPTITGYNFYLEGIPNTDVSMYDNVSYLRNLLPAQHRSNDVTIQNATDISNTYGGNQNLFERQCTPDSSSGGFRQNTNDFLKDSDICAQNSLNVSNCSQERHWPLAAANISTVMQANTESLDQGSLNRLMLNMQHQRLSPFPAETPTEMDAFVPNMGALHISGSTSESEQSSHHHKCTKKYTDPELSTDDATGIANAATKWW